MYFDPPRYDLSTLRTVACKKKLGTCIFLLNMVISINLRTKYYKKVFFARNSGVEERRLRVIHAIIS